jgi:anti-sigma-K factor RskA
VNPDGMRDHEDRREALAAYALGALDPAETVELERHVAGCDTCREHLRWLDPALEVLAESVEPVEPPPALRERVMAEVRADAGMQAAAEPAEPRRPREGMRPRLRRWAMRPAVGLAAMAIVAAGIAGYALRGDEDGVETTPVVRAGGVTASIEHSGDAGTLQLTGLEQLPMGEVYQAWVQHGEEITPSSVFEAHSDGTASAAIPERLEGADAVMVTVEPSGGSTEPGSAPVVNLPLQ